MLKVERRALGFVNVEFTVSDNEIRLWACNKDGMCVFRLKATGNLHKGEHDVIIMGAKDIEIEERRK